MSLESRTKNSIKNAKIGIACYVLSLLVSFFTRGILLSHYGTEFIGLLGIFSSFLGFLGIAELGVSVAISVVLYKPLLDGDYAQISQIVSVLGYLYRKVGYLVLALGILISFSFPFLYPDLSLPWHIVFFGFYVSLLSILLGYFINYTSVLLSADQRNYVVVGYCQLAYTAKVICQIILALYYPDFLIFFVLELIFSLLSASILHVKIRQEYPWLKCCISEGKDYLTIYPEIVTKIKQLFVHRIGSFVQNHSAPLFISSFVSLPMVALYGNYVLITNNLKAFVNNLVVGTYSSVGNLVAEDDTSHSFSIYREMLSSRFFIVGFLTFSFCNLVSEFITLWLGPEYCLSDLIVILLSVCFFLSLIRDVTDQFLNGYGLVQDTWSPIVESVFFIITSLIGGAAWGLPGIILAPIVSMVAVIFVWKPYFLFHDGFHLPIWRYVQSFGFNLVLLTVSFIVTSWILRLLFVDQEAPLTWTYLVMKSATLVFVFLFVSFITFSVSSDFRHFTNRLMTYFFRNRVRS